jgi:lactoylglutathione lyase
VMGFEVRVDAGVYVELTAGDVLLGVYERSLMAERVDTTDRPATATAQDPVCLTFEVDDVDKAVEELRTKGAEIVTEPHDEEDWVLRVAHLRDPAGNLLEINAPLSPTTPGG